MFVDLLLARAELYDGAEPTAQWLTYVNAERLDLRACYVFCGILAVMPCAFYCDRFDFALADEADAEPAAVIECLDDEIEAITDLCAWPLADPTRFAIMFGTALALGNERVGNPATYFAGQHLQLYRTPLRWLQAGCDGAVILDQASAHLWLSRALGNVAGEDREHAEATRAAAMPPPSPRILAPLEPRYERRSPRVRRAR